MNNGSFVTNRSSAVGSAAASSTLRDRSARSDLRTRAGGAFSGSVAGAGESVLLAEPLLPQASASVLFATPSMAASASTNYRPITVRVDRDIPTTPFTPRSARRGGGSAAANNNASSASFGASIGAEGDLLSSGLHDEESEARADAITYAMSMGTLDRIRQVTGIISDYFDEPGTRYFAPKLQAQPAARPPNLRGFIARLRQIPLAGHVPSEEAKPKKERTVAATRVANMIVDVGKLIQDKAELANDAWIAVLSVACIILMFLGNVVAWIPRTAREVPTDAPTTLAPRPPRRTITRTIPRPFITTADWGQTTPNPSFSTAIAPSPSIGPTTSQPPKHIDVYDLPLSSRLSSNALLTVQASTWFILALSVLTVLLIIRLYARRLRRKQIEWSRVGSHDVMARSDAYEFWRSRLPFQLFAEVAIHLIFPYPWWSILDSADAKYLDLMMLLRLYTVLRLLHRASPLYRARREILRTNAELRVANFSVRLQDTLKLYFFSHTVAMGLAAYLLVALVGGFVVHVAERDSNNGYDPAPNPPFTPRQGFNTLLDGVYFMVMSIRTVGYGDLRPITIVGRVSAVIFQFLGMGAGSVLGSVVINRITKTPEEKMVDEYLGAFAAWYELRVAAAMLIQAAWKASIGYQSRHGKVPREQQLMARRRFQRTEALRQAVHRQNTQVEVATLSNTAKRQQSMAGGSAAFRDVVRAIREPDDSATSSLGLQSYLKILTRSNEERARNAGLAEQMRARARARKARLRGLGGGGGGGGGSNNGGGEGYLEEETDLSPYLNSREGERFRDLYRRMPYMQTARVPTPLPALVARLRAVFSPEASMARWSKSTSVLENPRGFKAIRTFPVSKRVIDHSGSIRHVPVGEGHKADIRLHALQQFRLARQAFNQTAGTSSDHIIDRNLTIVFRMLVSASKKLRRNEILLEGLHRALVTETAFTDRVIGVSLGGGYETAPITAML